MDDEDFDPKYCLLVKINPAITAEDKDLECLDMHMENLTGDENIDVKFDETSSRAVIKFNRPVDDVESLQKKSDEKPRTGYKITLEAIPPMDKVLVTGLPPDKLDFTGGLSNSELVLYFENKRYCPDGGYVTNLDVLPCRHAAVVQFKHAAVVKKLKSDHKLEELQFAVRPLSIFEVVDRPSCSECDREKKDADYDAEGTEQPSWHSADEDNEDTGSRKNDTQSDSQSDTDEDMKKSESKQNSKDTKTQTPNEHSSFTSASSSWKKFTEPDNSETEQLLLTTIKCKRIPGLQQEDYEKIKINKSTFEIMDDKQKTDHIRKAIDDVQGYGEVDLANFTRAANKLNNNKGRKWIAELLKDLEIPANLKHNESTLMLRAINIPLAKEAAQTVAKSLLPAKIKCDENQMKKCSNVLQDKTPVTAWHRTGDLYLLGIPMDVIKAVGEIEQKLHGGRWLRR